MSKKFKNVKVEMETFYFEVEISDNIRRNYGRNRYYRTTKKS